MLKAKCTEVIFMSKNKSKVRKLTDEQYNAYITSLRDDPALYMPDGTAFVPDEINPKEDDAKQGD